MMSRSAATPLCPSGHLPHKGGDWLGSDARPAISPIANVKYGLMSAPHVISPLVGEMSGRTEGGNPPTLRNEGQTP